MNGRSLAGAAISARIDNFLLLTERADMHRTLLKSKIHRATVTEANLHYEGSVTIDCDLMERADLVDHEQVHIYDVNNGNRLITYAIPGERGTGVICINGAAAHLVQPGNLIIICAYAQFTEPEAKGYQPKVVHVDARNRAV
jgi:aspartate 1-decarboxylase